MRTLLSLVPTAPKPSALGSQFALGLGLGQGRGGTTTVVDEVCLFLRKLH
jgi:hypothetical protein